MLFYFSIICLLFGSLITYQQILNDVGPVLVTKVFDIQVRALWFETNFIFDNKMVYLIEF